MKLRRKSAPAAAPDTTADEEDDVSEPGIADFLDTRLPERDRRQISQLLQDELTSRQTAAEQADANARVAAELNVPAATLARDRAEAEYLKNTGWRSFVNARGLAERPAPDRLIEARAASDALERRRARLEARLKIETIERKRMEVVAALDAIDEQENRFWALLHPPAINGEAGLEVHACVKCDGPMTKRENYSGAGVCAVCIRAYQLLTGLHPPTPTPVEERTE